MRFFKTPQQISSELTSICLKTFKEIFRGSVSNYEKLVSNNDYCFQPPSSAGSVLDGPDWSGSHRGGLSIYLLCSYQGEISAIPEAEFLNVRVFSLLFRVASFTPPPPPCESCLELVWNVNIVCIRKPQVWELSRLCPETSTKFHIHIHEFGPHFSGYFLYHEYHEYHVAMGNDI